MKRLPLFLFAFLLFGQTQKAVTWTALSATGTTASFSTGGADVHSVSVVVTGSPSGCTINLDGSLDNSHWSDISGPQTCTANLLFHVVNRKVAFVRGNLTTFSGGTAPTAAVSYLGASSGGRQ